ncbi:hypothetical protein QBC40DRAFT_182956 [Triangularia verruculosa]|uniref:Uncharacterized protein n=1 Tax=Triangularia verruculosa TaxID=2587418 RepID=A0AAN6X9N0_9PEZI|nr:hypothetical protein QBC40DRAFT_182956 [Triangularia verruculosa]
MKVSTVIAVPVAFAIGASAQLAQCQAACRGGEEAVNRFCRTLRDARLRAGCWALAVGVGSSLGQTACLNWCYWQYGALKRDVVDVLEGRGEVSLASDFALTGLEAEKRGVEVEWTA